MRVEHRVTTPASPAEVWALPGDLDARPSFELLLERLASGLTARVLAAVADAQARKVCRAA